MRTSAKIMIFGYVGKDPIAPSANNPNFVTFSLSVMDKRKDKNTNEEIKTTAWFECQTGNEATAESLKKYVKKGMQLYLEGYPRCDSYTDKDGKPAASFKVNITEFRVLDSKDVKEDTKSTPKVTQYHNDLNDDEIPF